MIRTLVDVARQRAADSPGRGYHFLGVTDEHLTYAELDRDARRWAAALRGRRGERALLVFPPGLDVLRALWGCLYAGVVAVLAPPPVPARLTRSLARLRAIAADALPSIGLGYECDLGLPRPEPQADGDWVEPDLQPDDLALLQYTSGSTRTPRGVMLSHANLLHNLDTLAELHADARPVVMMHWLPLYHDMGLIRGTLSPLHMGGDCWFMSPIDFVQRPLRWLQALTRVRATITGAPNFGYELAARKAIDLAGLDLSALRVAFCSAEPIRARTIDRFVDAFAGVGFRREAFRPSYGLAEATVMVTGETGPGPRVWDGQVSCGRALGGQEVLLVDEAGRAGAAGEVWVRGPSVARGYFGGGGDGGRGEAVFAGRLADGRGPFLRTGDLGWRAPDGGLCISGRLTDLIVVRGVNVQPHEVEATIEAAAPAVRPGCTAVFGVDLEETGTQGVVAVCETAVDDAAPLELAIRAAVAEEHDLALHGLRFVAPGEVPKTMSGKVQRAAAREQLWKEPARFEWPRFRAGDLAGLLAGLDGRASAYAVLSALFPDELATPLARLAPRVDHVGMVAPSGMTVALAEAALRGAGFTRGLRRFASEIWAREVSARFGRPVDVTIVHAARASGLGAEIFVAQLSAQELESLVEEEAGCHVALALAPGATFAQAQALLQAHGHAQPPFMAAGPSTNNAIASRVLYVDVVADGRRRRLELIARG